MGEFEFQFEWDDAKALSNERKHGLRFDSARKLFRQDEVVVGLSQRTGEVRLKLTGNLEDVLITVVFTIRGERIRLISARKASNAERRKHRQLFGDRT